jgi:hypothetical protein
MADLTQLRASTMHVLRTAAHVTTSLDQPVDNEGSTALVELLADPQAVDPLQSAIEREQRDDLSAMLRLLPQRHRRVLAGRYGLDGKSVQSHEQIGRRLGVGEERSRQVEHESLHRLCSIPTTLARAAYGALRRCRLCLSRGADGACPARRPNSPFLSKAPEGSHPTRPGSADQGIARARRARARRRIWLNRQPSLERRLS